VKGMEKPKKTDLKKVIQKSRKKKSDKNNLSDFKEHLTKPIIEPKNKGKNPKEKIGDGKKPKGKKGREKTDEREPGNKTAKGKDTPGGGKTTVQRPVKQGKKGSILPPWWDSW